MGAPKLFSRFRIDILVISPDVDILKRAVQISEKYNLTSHRVGSLEEYEASFDDIGRPNLILLDITDCTDAATAKTRVEQLRNFVPKADLVCIASDSAPAEYCEAMRSQDVYEVMTLTDVKRSVRADFIVLHRFLLGYYPIELSDLFPNTEINFNAFHFLKLNNKYLPVVFGHFILSDKKAKKLETFKTLFISRDDVDKYQKYIENYYDSFSTGLRRRVKATFLQQIFNYSRFVEALVFRKKTKSGANLEDILKSAEEAQSKLLGYLASSNEPLFLYYQKYTENPMLKFDRTPLVIGMAAVIAEATGLADPVLILQAGLIGYAGISHLDQLAYLKWHDVDPSEWTEIEKEHFAKFIDVSISLGKQVQGYDEGIGVIISCLFERFDGKGYPGKISGEAIPPEAAIIQISERWLRTLANQPIKSAEHLSETLKECALTQKDSGLINPEFAMAIREANFLTKIK